MYRDKAKPQFPLTTPLNVWIRARWFRRYEYCHTSLRRLDRSRCGRALRSFESFALRRRSVCRQGGRAKAD